MKKAIPFILCVTLMISTAGCATQPYPDTYDAPGFFSGLWHGAIMIPSLMCSFFMDDVRIYAFPNSGVWYDLGFVIGSIFDLIYIAGIVIAVFSDP